MDNKRIILTGHRPTGPRHIGHYVGTLKSWVEQQNNNFCNFLIADLLALTTNIQTMSNLDDFILEVLADWIASGIDPEKSNICLQSAIPEHSLLAVLLSMIVSTGRLERVPTYKDQVRELKLNPSLGFLNYPVLQAADILLYKAHAVPVGEDQLPHIELTREIARRFNQTFQPVFPIPEPIISTFARLPGIDNRTMHTSYSNTILIKDSESETAEKIMKMYTDPTRIKATAPGHVEGNPLFVYLDAFSGNSINLEEYKTLYRNGKIGDVRMKEILIDELNEYFKPIREKRKQIIRNKHFLLEILDEGTKKARFAAQQNLQEIMEITKTNLSKQIYPFQNKRSTNESKNEIHT